MGANPQGKKQGCGGDSSKRSSIPSRPGKLADRRHAGPPPARAAREYA
jgi:hypothetical protein